jgi:GMP synthase-like glutamine amidotransferase
MSSELEIAIAERATIIRIGTAVFGQRSIPDSEYWNEQHTPESYYHQLPLAEDIDVVVIMVGPMNVDDEKVYPWLREEKDAISVCIMRHKKVLCICLGAQLIASCSGARMPQLVAGTRHCATNLNILNDLLNLFFIN